MAISFVLITSTLLVHIALVLGLIAFLAGFRIPEWFKKKSLWLGFYVSVIASLGSLYYSEIMGFTPCVLCWYQRIFMYVLPFIFGSAIVYNDYKVIRYVLPISVMGLLISAYHYLVQVTRVFVCTGEVDCAIRYTFSYGYITIPVMAFTAFLLVLLFSWLAKN